MVHLSLCVLVLLVALIFRAMPPIKLVSGYLLPFSEWNLWGRLSTTILVLVANNLRFFPVDAACVHYEHTQRS